jgi:hypothetical protein
MGGINYHIKDTLEMPVNNTMYREQMSLIV